MRACRLRESAIPTRGANIRIAFPFFGALVAVLCLFAPSALAYEFGPTVRQLAPEQTVFDWSSQRCDDNNIPDSAARAFTDASNRVQLTLSVSYGNRRMIGPDLNTVVPDCAVTMGSDGNADPAAYDDQEWIAAPWTPDGTKVYAIVHEEYHGWEHPGMCNAQGFPTRPKLAIYPPPAGGVDLTCWYNSLTLATSVDGGSTFTHATPPAQLAASIPYQYVANTGPYGYFQPSNIIRMQDGYFYTLMHTEEYQAQQRGVCVMRAKNPASPTSWRAWDGTGYNVKFINPYIDPSPPEQHVCLPVALPEIDYMTDSLTYNSFFRKWLLVGVSGDWDQGQLVYGVYYSTSADLITWSHRQLVFKAGFPWIYQCGDDDPISYPSALDPKSTNRNFTTTAKRTYLYFTRFNYDGCVQTNDRDLIRIPIEFLATTPGPTTEGP